jgi:PadR family transcriptional regulator, regulatory protein PadR
MGKNSHLSTHELMTLLAILRLGKEAYGVPISHEIEAQSGREVAVSGIYAALERLEHRGLITAELGEATPQRGGRAKTYFRVTAAGLREIHAAKRAFTNLWRGVPDLEGRAT